jgi:hypothetical protein
MSEQLPPADFDSQNYERPNQKWICGHAAEGSPCRQGPDNRGRCRATAECAPVLEKKAGEEKGRWRCTRPGGACDTGPLPDGSCGRPVVKCAPVASLRTRRGQVTRAVVVATIGLLLILLGGSWRGNFINPGGLSTAHSGEKFAALQGTNSQTCAACHQAGNVGPSGLISAAWHANPGPFAIAELASARRGKVTAIDQACNKCHTSHTLHQPNADNISCSHCHREHRGSGLMAATTDAHCGFCHSDATVMTAASSKGMKLPPEVFSLTGPHSPSVFQAPRPRGGLTNVMGRFSEDHPEFRLHTDKMRDPNTLKFNHALHLTGETVPKLPTGQKLNCVSCHQAEAAGIYFQRINFEKHCQACHSLQFDPETPGLTLPHGNPEHVSAFLHSLPKQYADFAARSGTAGVEAQNQFAQQKLRRLQARVVSGEDFEKRVFFSTATSGPEVRVGSVSGATHSLYPGCVYCHEVTAGPRGQANITTPAVFDRWLSRATFNHAKHTAVSCAHCHQAATSKDTADILLPMKSSCVTCHSAAGGVSDSCATCHSYHKKPTAMAGH